MARGRPALHMHARLALRAGDARTRSCSHVSRSDDVRVRRGWSDGARFDPLGLRVDTFCCVGEGANWVDAAVGEHESVSVLWAEPAGRPLSPRSRHRIVVVGEFFNRSIGDVYELGSPMPYGLPSTQVHVEAGPVYSTTADQPHSASSFWLRVTCAWLACRSLGILRRERSCFVCTVLFAPPSHDRPRVRGVESRERFTALGLGEPPSLGKGSCRRRSSHSTRVALRVGTGACDLWRVHPGSFGLRQRRHRLRLRGDVVGSGHRYPRRPLALSGTNRLRGRGRQPLSVPTSPYGSRRAANRAPLVGRIDGLDGSPGHRSWRDALHPRCAGREVLPTGPGLRSHHQWSYLGQRDIAVGAACRARVEVARALARSGVVVGLAIASKLFLWPLLFWLLGTRRYRALGAAAVAVGTGLLVPWAALRFDGLSSYPDLLHVAQELYAVHSYSVATMLSALGVETGNATRGALALGLAIAVLAFVAGRRNNDEISVSLALLAAILGSPIVWENYYTLLLVPLAIARPRFSGLWVVPVLFYFMHRLPRPRLFANELEPGGTACCKPDDVPLASWVFNHTAPGLWPAFGHAVLAAAIVTIVAWTVARPKPTTTTSTQTPLGGLRASLRAPDRSGPKRERTATSVWSMAPSGWLEQCAAR